MTEPEPTVAEGTSDADLRAWAKDNGIDDVPASGKLSVSWRETITNAMAAALDPKDEGTAETTSTTSSTPETETKSETEWIPDPEEREALKADLDEALAADLQLLKEAEEPVVEYRTPWVAPETWVTGQAYTA